MKIQMTKKEEYCENLEEEVISLRVEVEKLNKKLKKFSVLDKTNFGYIGDASCKENENYSKSIEVNRSSTQPANKV
jgi:hypothetical protein